MRNKQRIMQWLEKYNDNILIKFLHRFYEPISYLFFGVLTTVVNLVVYSILEGFLGQENWYLSNLPAILISILFAYITNRSFVFDSDGSFWREMLRFFSARIFVSFIFEYATAYLLFNVLEIDYQIQILAYKVSVFKIMSQIMVIFGNYFASKLLVFKSADSGQ